MNRKLLGDVYAKTKGHCWYCGAHLDPLGNWQIDHQTPRAYGGGNEIDNLVPACRECNRAKSDRDEEDYKDFLYMAVGNQLEIAIETLRRHLSRFIGNERTEQMIHQIRTLDGSLSRQLAPIEFYGDDSGYLPLIIDTDDESERIA